LSASKKCGTRLLLVVALALLCSASSTRATEVLLVDASGSMKGFFQTRSLAALHDQILATCKTASQSFYFLNDGELKPYQEPGEASGVVTRLHKAFQGARRQFPEAGIIWMITDNIQDPEGPQEELGDINRFYQELRLPSVKRLYLFPAKLPFQGLIYGRDGHTRLGEYSGLRGLIVYAILLNDRLLPQFESQVKAFSDRSHLPMILGKPLGCKIQVWEDQEAAPRKSLATRLVFNPQDMAFITRRPFTEGDPLTGAFVTRFHSDLGNVILRTPRVVVNIQDDPWGQTYFHQVGMPEITVEPSRLRQDLNPGETSEPVRIVFTLKKGVKYSKHPQALWHYISSKEKQAYYRARIRLSLVTDPQGITLMEDVWKKYGTNDPSYFNSLDEAYQERIFGLDQLFQGIFSDFKQGRPLVVAVKEYQVRLPVLFPRWPSVLLVSLLVLALGLLFALAKIVRGFTRGRISLTSRENGAFLLQRRAQDDPVNFGEHPLGGVRLWLGVPLKNGQERIGSLRRRLSGGFRVKAARGFVVETRRVGKNGKESNGKESVESACQRSVDLGEDFVLRADAGVKKAPAAAGPTAGGKPVVGGRHGYPGD
jgi:hypothetical protein